MICPILAELPCPPEGKTGWPWTEESNDVVLDNVSKADYPKISIVTPSYNQGEYIEETIRSVLLQGYPNLEYIVCDGGSSDETVSILQKYSQWISFWVSEPDNGQSNAINKGFKQSSGDIAAWINSDDLYEKGAFNLVAHEYMMHPDYGLFYGDCLSFSDVGAHSILVCPHKIYSRKMLLQGQYFQQPSSFFNWKCLKEIGYINEEFHFCMDYDLFFRLCENYASVYIPATLARFRYQEDSKTVSQNYKFLTEIIVVLDKIIKTTDLDKKCMDIALTRMFWSVIKLIDFGVKNIALDGVKSDTASTMSPHEWLTFLLGRGTPISCNCVKNVYNLFSARYGEKIDMSVSIRVNRYLEILGYRLICMLSKRKIFGCYAVSLITYYPDMARYRFALILKYMIISVFLQEHQWKY